MSTSSSSKLPPFLQISPPPVTPPSTARLKALYASTVAQRTSNPTGYAANAAWWSGVLRETLRSGWVNGTALAVSGGEDDGEGKGKGKSKGTGATQDEDGGNVWENEVGGDRVVLRVDDDLLERYEWGGSKPKGFGGFIQSLSTSASPKLHPLPQFFASPTPLHAPPSITYRLVGRPLWWAVAQLNPFGGGEVGEEECWRRYGRGREYVHMELLEQSAAAFAAHISSHPPVSYTASLYDSYTFREEFGETCFPGAKKGLPPGRHRLGEVDCQVLLRWLERDVGVLLSDGTVIKLLEPGEQPAQHEITEADRGTLSILLTLRKLDKQIEDIEGRIEAAHSKAKKHLSQNQRSLAMSSLRARKALEELLERRVRAAEQLHAVVRSIDQAKGDVEIMDVYSTSTSTLATILRNPKLDPEYIASTTDGLADALADAEEIDQAIRDGGKIAVGAKEEVDEDELREELEGLVTEEREKEIREERRREEEKEAARKEESAMEEQRNIPENLKAQQNDEKAMAASTMLQTPQAKKDGAEAAWEARIADAQTREKEERARAEAERLRKEESRVMAE